MSSGAIKRGNITSWPVYHKPADVDEPVVKREISAKPVKRAKSKLRQMIDAPIIREPRKLEKAKDDYSNGYFGLSPEDRKKLREDFGEKNIKIAESRD